LLAMSELGAIEGPELPDGSGAASLPSLALHARERNRRLINSLLVGLVTKPLGLLAPLITAPLFVKYLGSERYGLFEAIIALSALLSLANAGLTLGLVNRLMDCHVSGDRELARRYVSSLLLTLAAIMLPALLVWTLVAAFTRWDHVFHISGSEARGHVAMATWITGTSVLFGLVFSAGASIYQAYQEMTIANVWDGIAKAVTFAACVGVVYTRFGLVGVAIASAAVPACVSGLSTAWLFWRRPWLRPRLASFDRRLVRSSFGDGLLLLTITSSVVLIFQCDKLVIGTVIGSASVTVYALIGRIFTSGYGVYMMLLMALWPAHGEALRRGDWQWVRHKLHLSLAVGFAVCVGMGTVLMVFGDTVFHIWTRGQINAVPRTLVLAVTATFLLRAWVDSRSIILNSLNILAPQVHFFVAHAVLNLVGAVVLSRYFGVAGVAWATPITALLTTAWGYPWMVRRGVARARCPLGNPPMATGAAPA
jgi:O-antigen/teichoic acid export membrane protein